MPVFVDPRSGDRYDVPSEEAEHARRQFGLVPEAEHELERTHGGFAGEARAFAGAAARGAFDAAVALPKLATTGASVAARALGATGAAGELDALGQQLTGSQFLENLEAVRAELMGEAATTEVAAKQHTTEARKYAEANPWASTTGYIGGQTLGALATGLAGASANLGKATASATASSALGRAATRAAVEGAAEGAALAGGQAGEEAWIRDEKLTAEQTMAAIGWATLLGAGTGGALGISIYGAGAVRRRAGEALSEASSRVAGLFGPRTTANADTVADVAGQALGVKVSPAEGGKIKDAVNWARERVEGAQVAATGADPDAVRKYGALRWDSEAVAGRDAFINREANLEGAKRAVSDGLQKLSDAVEPVIDEVRYAGLKREHVASAIDPERRLEQLAEARTQAQAVGELLVPVRRPGSAGKAARDALADAPLDRDAYLATFAPEEAGAIDDELDDEIRDALEALGKKTDEGTRAWKRVEQDVLRERVARQTPAAPSLDPREGALRAEVGNAGVLDEVERYVTRHLDRIGKTDDPVEAFMTLDSLKRGLQKYGDRTGKSARAMLATSPERAAGMRQVSDLIERFQEPLRSSLENEAVWGKAATNQRAINAALTRYIEGNKVFQNRFMRESIGYRGLDVKRSVRDDAVSGFLNRVGLADNQAAEAHLKAHLRATDDLLAALDGSLDLGEKKALVGKALGETRGIARTVSDLDRNVRVANQIGELLAADGEGLGSAGKTVAGAILGGAPGAMLGYAADLASHPGRSLRTAIGLQRLAKRHDVRIDQALSRLFGKAASDAGEARARDVAETVTADGASQVANDISANAADDVADEISEVRARPAAPTSARSARVAMPAAMATFLGDFDDKQAAFKARAKEIHEATADMGEKVRATVQRDMSDVSEQFPGFTGSLAAGLTRAALFLESKLPPSYRAAAPGAPGRSNRPVADHDIAKFSRYWSAVHDPVSVVHDLSLGLASGEQIEALRVVYPELYAKLQGQLLDRAAQADARGQRLPLQTRQQLGRFLGVQLEPAFKPSVLDTIERARQATDTDEPRHSAPPNLAQSAGPESVQMQQREARVG